MRHEYAAGCVVVREMRRKPLFLLVYSRSGFWGIPKGRREKGEHLRDTAIRELREETGQSLFFRVVGFRMRYRYVHGEGREKSYKTVVAYLVKTDVAKVMLSSEHTAFRWVSYEKAMQIIMFHSARMPVIQARRFLIGEKKMITLQEKAYREVRNIQKGCVASYADIAKRCRISPRMVARILANNYDSRVPCHRVVSSSGAILGYNRGIKEKERLLRKEGVVFVHSRGKEPRVARSSYERNK